MFPEQTMQATLLKAFTETLPAAPDAETTDTLIGIHGAMTAYWNSAVVTDEQMNAMEANIGPVERLLTLYQPQSLSGVHRLLRFVFKQMKEDRGSEHWEGWINAASFAVLSLSVMECQRRREAGIPSLLLESCELPDHAK